MGSVPNGLAHRQSRCISGIILCCDINPLECDSRVTEIPVPSPAGFHCGRYGRIVFYLLAGQSR
jgi:hypothetical protein